TGIGVRRKAEGGGQTRAGEGGQSAQSSPEPRLPPLQFALALDHLAWTRGEPAAAVSKTIHHARLADEAGFDSVWLNEDPEGWDAFAFLGALARETTSVRLGTGVTNPFHRHPNLIAASV